MPVPCPAPSSVWWDVGKLLIGGLIGAIAGGIVTIATVRLKRATEHADECITHLDECVLSAGSAMRKMAQAKTASVPVDAMERARASLGQEASRRFGKNDEQWKSISAAIASLDLALDSADPTGRKPITKARAGELDEAETAIRLAQSVCVRTIVRAAKRNWSYRIWGKYN